MEVREMCGRCRDRWDRRVDEDRARRRVEAEAERRASWTAEDRVEADFRRSCEEVAAS